MIISSSIRHAFNRLFATRKKHNATYQNTSWHHNRNGSLPDLQWIKMLNRKVYLHDGSEIGTIEAVNQNNVVIKNGSIKPQRYCMDHSMLKKLDSGNFCLDLVASELSPYERKMVPNPSCYVTLGSSYFAYMPHFDKY